MAIHSSQIQRAAARSGGSVLPQPRGWAPLPPQSEGRPLPAPVRLKMERSLGHDFADVRIHQGLAAEAIGANAFARGPHIHFAPGQYRPHSPEGWRLLAHELTHVVQQRAGRVRAPAGPLPINDNPSLEAQAEAAAKRQLSLDRRMASASFPMGTSESGRQRQDAASGGITARTPIQCNRRKRHRSVPPKQASTAQPNATYMQEKDPTVTPFLPGGKSFMGQAGAEMQLTGVAPPTDKIRVRAKSTSKLRNPSGLHEIVPTNLLKLVADSGNPALVGAQSGLRTSTAMQLLSLNGEVGAHTGFARKPSGKGSTHTKGQAQVHDHLREVVKKNKNETDPAILINELGLAHIKYQPTGRDVLDSSYITGMLPNQKQFSFIGPVSKTPDPERLKLAQWQHEMREAIKLNLFSFVHTTGKGRPPSPLREKITSKGLGGNYDSKTSYTPLQVPQMGGKTPFELAANMGAWLTAPQREGFIPNLALFGTPTSTSLGSKTSATGPTATTAPQSLKRMLPISYVSAKTKAATKKLQTNTRRPVTRSMSQKIKVFGRKF